MPTCPSCGKNCVWAMGSRKVACPWCGYNGPEAKPEEPVWLWEMPVESLGGSGVVWHGATNIGFTAIPVLEFLWGGPLDEVVWSALHALYPSRVRVLKVGSCETTDGRPGRVTIRLNEDGTIADMDHEVEIGSVGGIRTGYEFSEALRQRNQGGG